MGFTAKHRAYYDKAPALNLWCDCGPHYRAGLFMGFWLVLIPETYGKDTFLNFDVEGHGKGIVDGHFGRMSYWLNEAAKEREISDCADLCAALQQQSSTASSSAICVFINFTPPPKHTLKLRALDCTTLRSRGLAVQSSYSWTSSKDLAGHVILHTHTLTGQPSVKQTYAPVTGQLTGEDAEAAKGKDWRVGYRKHAAEKEPPSLKALRKHYQDQSAIDLPLATRHTSFEAKVATMQRIQVRKKKEKAAFMADLAPAPVDVPPEAQDSDSSSSSSSSSSDSDSSSSSSSD